MTQREAREAILAGNLRDHLGRKPVAIGVNPHNMSDCWLLYKRPENDDPLPISTDGVSAYLDWSQWIGKEKT